MRNLYSVSATAVLAAILTGCAGNSTFTSAPTAPAPATSALQSADRAPVVQAGEGGAPTLYVLNSGGGQAFGVTVYSNGGGSRLRNISLGKYSDGFTVDRSGRLYVGLPASQGDPSGPGLLNIYANRGAKVIRTLHQTHPFGLLALDAAGNLFTKCAADRLCEYASAKQRVIRKIALKKFGGFATDLAVDGYGNLAVDNFNGPILIFAPGATEPSWMFTVGIDNSSFLTFNSSGDLYVANFGADDQDPGSVTVYAQGNSSPIRTITNGIVKPSALAFDGSGDLYVLNYCLFNTSSGCNQPPSVTVYAPGGSTPIQTITQGIDGEGALALDLSGNLYVANKGNALSPPDPGSVTVYAPGTSSPKRTVTKGIKNPIALGIGP